MPQVLFVEDDVALRELVVFHLELADFETTVATDGKAGLQLAREREFDVIILDVMLPDLDGVTLCQTIRREGPNRETPILMLTARAEEADRITGLESGADDYVTKPFSVREVLARLKALLRRPRNLWRGPMLSRRQPSLSLMGVTIDPTRRRVVCDGRTVSLTPHEFRLLYLLASNPGVVFGREELRARIWAEEVFVTTRGVDTLVKRLRRKIERDPTQPERIVTARGSGYKFGDD